jgi:hypothetical protein
VQARAQLEQYRGKAKALATQQRDTVKEALFVGEVVGAGYAVSRLSAHLGGPEGRSVLGVPIELGTGAMLGGLGLLMIARRAATPAEAVESAASAKEEAIAGHLLALGAGAVAAYTSRLGFEAGLKTAKPPKDEEPQANASQVSGMPPQICYYLPAPPQPYPALPASIAAPMGATPVQQTYVAEIPAIETAPVGADEIDSAVEILDRMNRR